MRVKWNRNTVPQDPDWEEWYAWHPKGWINVFKTMGGDWAGYLSTEPCGSGRRRRINLRANTADAAKQEMLSAAKRSRPIGTLDT
jgi:hypothetical protein